MFQLIDLLFNYIINSIHSIHCRSQLSPFVCEQQVSELTKDTLNTTRDKHKRPRRTMKLFQVAVATAAMILFLGVEAKCPLEGKCSYVADKVAAASAAGNEAGDKAGCPLSKAGCPYFDKHAKDATVEAALAADMASKCPMEKCPHYEVRFVHAPEASLPNRFMHSRNAHKNILKYKTGHEEWVLRHQGALDWRRVRLGNSLPSQRHVSLLQRGQGEP